MAQPCGGAPKCIFNQPSSCVFYEGELLATIGINTGDNLTTILDKIDDFLQDFDGGGSTAETPNNALDTNSIDIVLSGTSNRTISANLKISPNTGNKLSILSNGVFAAPATSSVSYNSSTGVLTITVDGVASSQTLSLGNYSETVYGS